MGTVGEFDVARGSHVFDGQVQFLGDHVSDLAQAIIAGQAGETSENGSGFKYPYLRQHRPQCLEHDRTDVWIEDVPRQSLEAFLEVNVPVLICDRQFQARAARVQAERKNLVGLERFFWRKVHVKKHDTWFAA